MAITIKDIDGFYLIPNIFTEKENIDYMNILENEKGNICYQVHKATEYGWNFLPIDKDKEGNCRRKTQDEFLGEFPEWLKNIWTRAYTCLKDENIFTSFSEKNIFPDHVLINKYEIGDGADDHTDDLTFWGDWIVGVSFGSGCTFCLTSETGTKYDIYLPKLSVYLMKGDVRYKYKHGITFDKFDIVYGNVIPRTKRISLTFREIDKRNLPENYVKYNSSLEIPKITNYEKYNSSLEIPKITNYEKYYNTNKINLKFPEYDNTESSCYDDTKKFLKEIIGTYIEIKIKSNVFSYEFYVNSIMVNNHDLSDNIRCYTDHSVPTISQEHGIVKLFENLAKTNILDDIIVFIALGDFPILMKNKNKHPHCNRYIAEYDNIYPQYLAKIFSRSIIQTEHNDIMFPTRDFIDCVYNLELHKKETNHDFANKKPMAIFRGSITGNDRSASNTRIRARLLSLQYPTYLDVELTQTFPYYMFETYDTCICTEINDKRIYDDKNYKSINKTDQGKQYKYILHIDGFVSAWRMAEEMLSMSVILKVESPWLEHFYDKLKPWYHYIPIKEDLSDLIPIIKWCNNNIALCQIIAKNAYDFAIDNFTEKKMFDYVISKLYDTEILDNSGNNNEILTNDIVLTDVKQEINIQFNNIKYNKYLLPINKKVKYSVMPLNTTHI
jgi:hypothetical protein